MSAATVPAVYAGALLALADERGHRAAVVADCRELAASFRAAPELLAALRSSQLGRERSKGLLRKTLGERIADELRDLLLLLIDRGRFDVVLSVLDETVAQAEREAGRVLVDAASAVELQPAVRQRLESALGRRLGDGVEVRYRVEPALKGGLLLRYGDVLVDSSVRRHLNAMKQLILAAPIPAEVWAGEMTVSATDGGRA